LLINLADNDDDDVDVDDDDEDEFEDAVTEVHDDPPVPQVPPVVVRPVQRFVDFAGVLNDDVEDNEDEAGFTMDEIRMR
jgi:hypothetical protein